MDNKKTKEEYIAMLREAAEKHGRLPKKSDFELDDVIRMKSFWGPWPRALEAAALKDDKNEERIERNRQKRLRAKAARQKYKNLNN